MARTPRHLLSTTEASVRLGISANYVARLAREGRLPVLRDYAGSVIGPEYAARKVNEKAVAYCAYVAEVETGKTVACLHARGITETEYARELAAIGHFYNKAEIAVEKAGGYGTATIIELRDAYRYYPIYQNVDHDSTDKNDPTGSYGFPMSTITRPLVSRRSTCCFARRLVASWTATSSARCAPS